jgi:hypothetical protein
MIFFRFNPVLKKHCSQKNTSKRAVSLRSFPLFRWAVPVSRSSFRSTDHSQRKKQEFRKKNTCFFSLLRSQSSHGHFLRSSGLLHLQDRSRRYAQRKAVFASAAPCALAVAQPPAINLKRNAFG